MSGLNAHFGAVRTIAVIIVLTVPTRGRGAIEELQRELTVLREHHIEPTLEGVTLYLQSLRTPETRGAWQDELAAKLVGQLNSEDWTARDAASRTLATMVFRAKPALNEAIRFDDLEVAWRARQVLEQGYLENEDTAQHQGRIIEAVCRSIAGQPIQGAAPALIDAIPHIHEKYVLGWVRRALAVTARAEDADLLRRAMSSENQEVRIAAITALASVLDPVASVELHPLLADQDPLIRVTAAHALARLGDRAALPVLVELLAEDQIRIRSECIRVLDACVGQDFDYSAYDALTEQNDALERWRQWLANESAKAELLPFTQLEPDEFEAFYRTARLHSMGGNGQGGAYFWVNDRLWAGNNDDFNTSRGLSVLAVHHGQRILLQTYDTYGDPGAADAFAAAIDALPAGCFVMIGINDEATRRFNDNGQRALASVGAALDLRGGELAEGRFPNYHASYICAGYKGLVPGYAIEKLIRRGRAYFSGK